MLSELHEITVAVTATATSIDRTTHSRVRSLKCFNTGCSTFSVSMLAGASSVPLAVDKIADSNAPKNSSWHHAGVEFNTRLGSTFCTSRASSAAKWAWFAGSIMVAE